MSAECFESIASFLPLQSSDGALRWSSNTEHALEAVAKGPRRRSKLRAKLENAWRAWTRKPKSEQVNNAADFCNFLETLRKGSNQPPLQPQVFRGLTLFFDEFELADEFFRSILPKIAALALELPSLLKLHEAEAKSLSAMVSAPTHLRILSSQECGIVILRQHLIAGLLACSFLCLYPVREEYDYIGISNINFDSLFMSVSAHRKHTGQKLRCIVNYFRRVGTSMPDGSVSFERKVLPLKFNRGAEPLLSQADEFWSNSKKPLCHIKIEHDGGMEDAGPEYLQVDFANEQLGGGVLSLGCLQEEIHFTMSPECIVGMLFLTTMVNNEAIEIVGAERYSRHSGYGGTLSFAGSHEDDTRRDSLGRKRIHLVAIDALCFPGERQFEDELMIRELNKAYCGYSRHSTLCNLNGTSEPETFHGRNVGSSETARVDGVRLASEESQQRQPSEYSSEGSHHDMSATRCVIHEELRGVATGNWGCGAFGGDLQLKSFLQWLAASQAGCPSMIYFIYGDQRAKWMREVTDWIRKEGWSVSELWEEVKRYGKWRVDDEDEHQSELFEWILQGPTQKGMQKMRNV